MYGINYVRYKFIINNIIMEIRGLQENMTSKTYEPKKRFCT